MGIAALNPSYALQQFQNLHAEEGGRWTEEAREAAA
jgi:hypothetical protein